MNDVQNINPEIVASLVLNGDISKLNSTQRVQYYNSLCTNLGIDPLTQPFSIIKLQGKEVLYANKNCTQQLSKVYKISHEVTKTEKIEDVYAVTVRAKSGERFTDEIGAVAIASLKGDNLANALMKASTKAKRRAVLAFCGLGMLDETEIETISGAVVLADKIIEATSNATLPKVEPKPIEQGKANQSQENAPDRILTPKEGNELLAYLKERGYTKEHLKQHLQWEYELGSILGVKLSHLDKIKAHFSSPEQKPKEKK